MNARSLILLMVVVVAVGAAVFLSRSYFSSLEEKAQTAEAPSKLNRILVAKETLLVGTAVELKQFAWVNWPDAALRPEYVSEKSYKSSDIVGTTVRHTLVQGAPLTRGSLINAKDRSTTAAVLTPGMRAVSVSINAQTGVAGFAFAGDRVDVILTHAVSGEGKDRFPISETVLQNVRLLGLDGRGVGKAGTVKAGKTATLEVTPKMAEKLALISRLGTLTLSLRSIQDADGKPSITPVGETLTGTWGSEVSRVLPSISGEKKQDNGSIQRASDTVIVTRGSKTTEEKIERGN